MLFMAMFMLIFQLQRCMSNAMFPQFLADLVFDRVCVAFGSNMHCGIMMMSVHAPNVDMMNVKYPFNFAKMRFDVLCVDTVGHLFQQKLQCFF